MKALITQQSIKQLASELPSAVAEVINLTLLSPDYRNPAQSIPPFESSFYYVQSTLRSLHYTPRNRGELSKNLTYTLFAKIVVTLSELAPTLFRHSLDSEKNQILPPYEVYQNKRSVTDYYMFPMVAGHKVSTKNREIFQEGQVSEDWLINRKKNSLANAEEYKQLLTDNDYFDPEVLLNHNWTQTLKKRPVGRPKKIKNAEEKKKERQRVTMKSMSAQMKQLEGKLEILMSRMDTMIK